MFKTEINFRNYKKMVIFYSSGKANQQLSHFYPSIFEVNNIMFNCAEQAYFFYKCKMLKQDLARKHILHGTYTYIYKFVYNTTSIDFSAEIMTCKKGSAIKQISKQLPKYLPKWDNVKKQIMLAIDIEKVINSSSSKILQ